MVARFEGNWYCPICKKWNIEIVVDKNRIESKCCYCGFDGWKGTNKETGGTMSKETASKETASKETASKELTDKERYDLIDVYALDQVAKVYTFGARKYDDNNWRKGLNWTICFGALLRHIFAYIRGEDINEESGLSHMAHAAWWCFTLLWYGVHRKSFDNRNIK